MWVGRPAWPLWISLPASRMLPNSTFVGLYQYASLMGNERWQVSVANLAVFGTLFLVASLALGFLLAVAIDQRVQAENPLRSIFLYPFSMSFIVTGLVWQWMLNPRFGIEKMVRGLACDWVLFEWLRPQDALIYPLVMAAVWHAAGLVMVIMLAGLRGIDEDIWKAARVDGLPPWRV